MRRVLLIAAAFCLWVQPVHSAAAASSNAPAQVALPSTSTSLPAAAVQSVLPITPPAAAPIAKQLGESLQTLVGAAPSPPVASAPALSLPVPTIAPAKVPEADDKDIAVETLPETIGGVVLDVAIKLFDVLRAQGQVFLDDLAALPDLVTWFQHQMQDPVRQGIWQSILKDIPTIIGIPFLFALAVELLLSPARMALRRRQVSSLGMKIAVLSSIVSVRLLPMLIFLGAAFALLGANEAQKLPRFVILNIVYGLTFSYFALAALRGFFAPTAPHLRLPPLSDDLAKAGYSWFGTASVLIVLGYFIVTIAHALRVPNEAVIAFENILGFFLALMSIIVIQRKRRMVTAFLRGETPMPPDPELWQILRAWLARRWHVLATVALIIGYGVTALGVDNGVIILAQGLGVTLTSLLALRISIVTLDRWGQRRYLDTAYSHRQLLRWVLRPLLWIAALLVIAAGWGANVEGFTVTPLGQRIVTGAMSVGMTLLVLTLLYEAIDRSIDRRLLPREGDPRPSARSRTLLPLARYIALTIFYVFALLALLRAIGLDVAPLLAGAGVLGVAIGFGSQTLIKDFLTGLFIVIENVITVGDWIKIGDQSGEVEAMTVRTIRLRDWDGSLHVIPFSEVTKLTNQTRGFSYALFDIGISYDSDIDKAIATIRDIAQLVREDAVVGPSTLAPAEVLGVDRLADSAIIIRGRIRTLPGKQFAVRRKMLQKTVEQFAKVGIKIPFNTIAYVTEPPHEVPCVK